MPLTRGVGAWMLGSVRDGPEHLFVGCIRTGVRERATSGRTGESACRQTTSLTRMRVVDSDLLKAYTLKVWKYKQGEVVSLMVHLGDRLGLYEAMAGGEELTPGELADRTGLAERLVREWLLSQAAAGLLTRTAEGTYSLEPEAEMVLADDSTVSFAGGAFIGGFPPDQVDGIIESFRTGMGVTYHQMGEGVARQIDRMNQAWVSTYLLDRVVPELDGVIERLEAGAEVADVGCGGAISVKAMARRFPASTFVGYEPSGHGVARARRRLADVANATVEQVGGEELPGDSRYDLILTLDCMHDVPFPDRIAAAIRRSIKDDGTWLIKDMKCSDVWEKNLKNPMLALQYGYSVSACLLSGASAEGGAALGTLGLPPVVAKRIVREAGFGSFRVFGLKDDPMHLYYEVRV